MAEYTYDAFISYRHTPTNIAVAKKLVQLLERMTGPNGKKLRIFRDREEFSTQPNLSSAIHKGLESSRFLIVVCSPAYKQSRYCMEELRYFRQLHGNSNARILPILVEGEPENVFPEELRWEERRSIGEDGREHTFRIAAEPLGADIRADSHWRSMRLLRREYLRLAAPILGKTFDQLYQRQRRRKLWTAGIYLTAVITGLIAFTAYNINMLHRIEQEHMNMLALESRRLATEAEAQLEAGNPRLAMLLALEALPQDLEDPEKPLITEAEAALRSAVYTQMHSERTSFLHPVATIEFYDYGWNLIRVLNNGNRIAITDQEWLYLYDPATGMQLHRYPSTHFSEAQLNSDGTLVAKCSRLEDENGVFRYRAEVYSLEEDRLLFEEDISIDSLSVSVCWDLEKNICYFYNWDSNADHILFCVDGTGQKSESHSLTEEQWKKIQDAYLDVSLDWYGLLSVASAYSTRNDTWSPLGEKYREYIELLWQDEYKEAAITEDEQLLIFYTSESQSIIYALQPLKMGFKFHFTLDGSCRVDCTNKRIYLFDQYALNIYTYCTQNAVTATLMGSNRCNTMSMVSSDGSKCMYETDMVVEDLWDTSYSGSSESWLRIFSCDDLTAPLLELLHDGYYVTPDLTHALIRTEEDQLQLWHTEKGLILTLDLAPEQAANVTGLCVSDDGSLLAAAWEEDGIVAVYSAADGTLVRQIDVSVHDGAAVSDIPYMEFEGTDLLISLWYDNLGNISRIVGTTGTRADICIEDGSSDFSTVYCVSGNTLTSDGLLFCTGNFFYGALDTIYDIRTGQCIFRNVAYYQYVESCGILLYVLADPLNGDSTVLHAAKRDESGIFADIYTVPLENGLTLCNNVRCMDENYVILSGNGICRIYEVETGSCLLSLHTSDEYVQLGRFYLADDAIFDLNYHHSNTVTRYPLLDTQVLVALAQDYLTSPLGERQLTAEEKAAFFID